MTLDDPERQNRGFYGFFGDFRLRNRFQERIAPKLIEIDRYGEAEIWGKAQRESARDSKSDWGLIRGVQNLRGNKVTWLTVKCISIRRTCIVDLGWVNICTCNFFVGRPKFTKFLLLNPAGIGVIQVCFRFLISWPVFEKFTVKVERCPKSGWIFEFLALPNFWGAGPQNLYISDHAHLKARHVAKFHGAIPTNAKVIGANMLKFKPIFDPLWKNLQGGPRCRSGVHWQDLAIL